MVRPASGKLGNMINYAKIFESELQRLLLEGEQIVDVLSVMYNAGREREPDESNPVTFDPINGLSVQKWNDAAEQAVTGLTLDLRQGREAAGLARDLGAMSFLVLTTLRLLTIDGLQTDATPRILWSTDLGNIAAVTHSPRIVLELGRLRVDFTDGSMVRLAAGALLPFAARRFVASFRSTTATPQ